MANQRRRISTQLVRMFHFRHSHRTLLLFAALWSLTRESLPAAWSGAGHGKPKDELDPNVRDWGDYSDLPPGTELDKKGDHGDDRVGGSSPNLAPELDFLTDIASETNKMIS